MKHKMINMGSQERLMKALNPNMITEVKNILYYNTGIYGSDSDNAMPQYLIQLQQASSIHANLCQTKFTEIQGNNLQITDDTNDKAMDLAMFIKKRNIPCTFAVNRFEVITRLITLFNKHSQVHCLIVGVISYL